MPRKNFSVDDWVRRYLKEEEPRSKSLIVSVFGDAIAPYAAGVWLGGLIDLLAPLGVNERLVRTSAFRLVEEDWLSAQREGRRSHYSLTASGIRRFDAAYSRIYTPPPQDWDGNWTMVILPRSNGDGGPDRLELRRELEWEGYASPTPGVLLHPAAKTEVLQQILDDLKLAERAVAFSARSLEGFATESALTLVERCWDLHDIGSRYLTFLQRFEPLHERLASLGVSPAQAFAVQTLLIHSFRRATLHDPRLPQAMLPTDWPGLQAYRLCREIYRVTYRPAQAHVRAVAGVDTSAVSSSRLGMRLHERFGGL